MRSWAAGIAVASVLALTLCAASPAPAADVARLPRSVQSPLPDEGSAADRAAVRASLVAALSAQEDQLSRAADGGPLRSTAARRALLQRVESARLASSDLRAMGFLTAHDVPFRSARFVVTAWQGVVVRGDRAKAYVLGRTVSSAWDGTATRTPTVQSKALLERDPSAPDGWLLTAVRSASEEQG